MISVSFWIVQKFLEFIRVEGGVPFSGHFSAILYQYCTVYATVIIASLKSRIAEYIKNCIVSADF